MFGNNFLAKIICASNLIDFFVKQAQKETWAWCFLLPIVMEPMRICYFMSEGEKWV